MPFLDAPDLARYRAIWEHYMTDTATNNRTSTTTAVRVASESEREERVAGLPRLFRLKVWDLELPWNTDVEVGDLLAVAGKPTYLVDVVDKPRTVQTVIHAGCFIAADADGNIGVPLPDTATFTNPSKNDTVTGKPVQIIDARVYVYEASLDLQLFPQAASYDWAIVFPSSLRYPGTSDPVRQGHQITWADAESPGWSTIGNIRRVLDPLDLTVAYVKQRGSVTQ